MLAFRAREGLDADEDLDEVLAVALSEAPSDSSADLPSSRMSCVGVTTSFAPEASVSAVCTPGSWSNNPVDDQHAAVHATANAGVTAEPPVVAALPLVQVVPTRPVVHAAPVIAPAPVIKAEPRAEESAPDPIRTRGMAKLLALQGYRDRALSIYDELLAVEPNNAELRAEADKLRGN